MIGPLKSVPKKMPQLYYIFLFKFLISEADPYCIVECEGKKYKSGIIYDCQWPEWNFQVLFYRSNPKNLPVSITIWNQNKICDSFIGKIKIDDSTTGDAKELVEELHGRRKHSDELVPGQIKIFLENFKNFEEI